MLLKCNVKLHLSHIPVGDRDLPSPSSRAEGGNECHRERVEKVESECRCPVGRLFSHGQTLLPLTERQARAGCRTRARCRQVTLVPYFWYETKSKLSNLVFYFICFIQTINTNVWLFNVSVQAALDLISYY